MSLTSSLSDLTYKSSRRSWRYKV